MTAVAYALNSTAWIITTSMGLSLRRIRLQRFSYYFKLKRKCFQLKNGEHSVLFFNILSENIGGRVQKRPACRHIFQTKMCDNLGGRVPKKRRDTQNYRSRIRLELNLMDDYDVHEVEFKADSTAAFFKHKWRQSTKKKMRHRK